MTDLSHDLAEADLTELFGLPDESGWQERALCAQTDPEAFFPEKGGSTREAKKICVGCEVKAECLEYALEHDERFGIWGGLSERERRRLKRRASDLFRCRRSCGGARSRVGGGWTGAPVAELRGLDPPVGWVRGVGSALACVVSDGSGPFVRLGTLSRGRA